MINFWQRGRGPDGEASGPDLARGPEVADPCSKHLDNQRKSQGKLVKISLGPEKRLQ